MSDNKNVYAFVGEKISVQNYDPYEGSGRILFDHGFKCKYRVIQWVYGTLPEDTIEFEAYDHYGYPPFARYRHVLLFFQMSWDKLYQEKYQFFDVYRTKSGRWAGCGDPYLDNDRIGKGVAVVPLEFEHPVSFALDSSNQEYADVVFKEPWFSCNSDSAVCEMGAYVEDLFRVKRDEVLMARGLFYVLPDTSRVHQSQ